MYQKYQTDAVVLSGREEGEADRVYALYTKDFGLVRARAAAVRREASRMRYALQSYSLANVSLVRGKRSWRVAGARPLEGASTGENMRGASAFGRVADLVIRLVQGEDKNEYLYETLVEARAALFSAKFNLEPAIPTMEIVCVARVLYALGYISAEALDTALFTHANFATDVLREAEMKRERLLESINRALSETHLVRR